MTPGELQRYLELAAAITHHQQALDVAVKEKQQLARVLYERYGRHAVYRIGEGDQQQDLMVARTKAGTHYFAPRVRYTKESRLAKAEKKRLDRAARMQAFPTQAGVTRPRTSTPSAEIEATQKRERPDDRPIPHCSVCGLPQTPSTGGLSCEKGHIASTIFPRRVDATVHMRKTNPTPSEIAPKLRLPIVGDVDQPPNPPEPRLLEIREPSGALLDDQSELSEVAPTS